MSEQALASFLKAANTDQVLAEGLVQAVGDKQGNAARTAVAGCATAKGYEITAADVAGLQKAAAALREREGELSDAELATVSGGLDDHESPFTPLTRWLGQF